jgi:hypothetical protein
MMSPDALQWKSFFTVEDPGTPLQALGRNAALSARAAAYEKMIGPEQYQSLGLSCANGVEAWLLKGCIAGAGTTAVGPTLPTWACNKIGSYLGYTGRGPNALGKAALDPNVWSGRASQEVSSIWQNAVLHQCIWPLIGAFCAPGHHGYQRACFLITGIR